jgi:phage major head subunit gpT-like protein
MIITRASMAAAYVGFNAAFQQGLGATPTSSLDQIAMTVNSTTAEEKFPWMKDLPGFREWIGERVVNNVANHEFGIKNKTFENTVGIEREKFEDDQYGTYSTFFKALGDEAGRFPSQLVFGFLKTANTQLCYDGQYLCDTDHPQIKPDGTEEQVSNFITGANPAWFLMDLSRVLKPIVWQERKPFDKLIRKDSDNDDNVFHQKKFLYGLDGRANVGAGLWQLIVMSKADLTPANYATARALFATFKKDFTGNPLGVKPTHLVVPWALEGKARKVLLAENLDGGGSNEWKDTAKLIVEPYLD